MSKKYEIDQSWKSFPTQKCRKIAKFTEILFRRPDSSVAQTYNFCGQTPSVGEGRFQAKNFLTNLDVNNVQFRINFSLRSPLWLHNSSCVQRKTSSQCVFVTLLTFPRQAAVGSFDASRSSKTFPDVRYKFRVSSCEHSTMIQNNHKVTGNVWSSRAACRLKITEIPGIAQRIYFIFFNFSIWIVSRFTVNWLSFLLEG